MEKMKIACRFIALVCAIVFIIGLMQELDFKDLIVISVGALGTLILMIYSYG